MIEIEKEGSKTVTDKELRRLSRRELLGMLIEQMKETEKSKQELEKTQGQLKELLQTYERLRKRLDQKDARIHELTDTLEAERTKRSIELKEAGSIAEAALRLNGVFEAAQKAADQYLYNIRLSKEGTGERCERKETD